MAATIVSADLTYTPPPLKTVATMNVGETSYTPKDYLVVDMNFGLYALGSGSTTDSQILGYATVSNQADGLHVSISQGEALFLQDTTSSYAGNPAYIPVVALTIV